VIIKVVKKVNIINSFPDVKWRSFFKEIGAKILDSRQ
jgi:hypothetical protein